MLLSTLMSGKTVDSSYAGWVTADDMVLAVDVSASQDADVADYAVVQYGTKSVTASLNPETKQSAYIRAGKSTTKTGNQRTIAFDCDRYVGDAFQDYADSIKYATGSAAVVNYVYFNILTGIGEKGTATLAVETDGSGNAEENLTFSGSLEKNGDAPADFTWHTATVTYSGTNITAVTVNTYTFADAVDDTTGSYVFTYSSTDSAWTLDSEDIDLDDYGITVTGTAADGDTITVVLS